jgi:hypothetical protein
MAATPMTGYHVLGIRVLMKIPHVLSLLKGYKPDLFTGSRIIKTTLIS